MTKNIKRNWIQLQVQVIKNIVWSFYWTLRGLKIFTLIFIPFFISHLYLLLQWISSIVPAGFLHFEKQVVCADFERSARRQVWNRFERDVDEALAKLVRPFYRSTPAGAFYSLKYLRGEEVSAQENLFSVTGTERIFLSSYGMIDHTIQRLVWF